MKHVYLAHPVGAPTKQELSDNLIAAKRWYRFFGDRHDHCAFMMNWLVNVQCYDDDNPEHLKLGMRRNLAQISLMAQVEGSELWLCGPRISNGMLAEAVHARELGLVIQDFTPLTALKIPAIEMKPTGIHSRVWRA